MIKGTEKAPAIRFRGFTDDWEQRKLGDIFEEYSDKGHPNLSALTIIQGGGTIRRDDSDRNLQYDKKSLASYKKVETGDFIVHLRSFEGGLEKATTSGIISPAYHTLHGKSTDSRFYYCYFRSERFINHDLKPYVYGIRDGRSIDIKGMKTINIPWTKVEEQKAIGNYIDCLDNLITLHQRKLELQKKLKAFFLQNMFPEEGETVPRIRFKGFTGDWEQRKLGEIGSTFTGLSGKTKEDFGHGDARFVTYMNVYSNSIADLAMTERVEIDQTQNSVKYGDIFFTTSSETPNEVGMSSVWLGNTENTYLNSFCFGYRPEVKVNPYYMAYMLRSPNVRNKLMILAQGISRYNISKNRVMDIEVPMPDLSEQKEIGQYFFNIDNLITLHQRKIDQLQTVKKFMLQNLFI